MTIKVHIRMQITMMRTRDQCVDDGDSRLDMPRTIMMIACTWSHVYIQNAEAMGGAWGSARVREDRDDNQGAHSDVDHSVRAD